jgi:hypothetical protein
MQCTRRTQAYKGNLVSIDYSFIPNFKIRYIPRDYNDDVVFESRLTHKNKKIERRLGNLEGMEST